MADKKEEGVRRGKIVSVAAFLLLLVVCAAIAYRSVTTRMANAARDDLLKAIASDVRPETFFPATSPVAKEDDPLASLDEKAIGEEMAAFADLKSILRPTGCEPRRHPLAPEERKLIAEWFASHQNVSAAINALAETPNYRSCIPGPESLVDAIGKFSFFDEPRTTELLGYARVNRLKACADMSDENADAAAKAFELLENLAESCDRIPSFITMLGASAVRSLGIDILSCRIDLWSDEALDCIVQAAEAAAAEAEGRFRDSFAVEVFIAEHLFANRDWAASPGVSQAKDSQLSVECSRLALYRGMAASWAKLEKLFPVTHSRQIGEELDAINDDEDQRIHEMPSLAQAIATSTATMAGQTVFGVRSKAVFVRTAVAIERYRRANGALPPSLNVLVPDWLPEIPRDIFTGEVLQYEPGPIAIPEETFPAIDEGAGSETRTLPAQTMSGFRLERKASYHRRRRNERDLVDFITQP